MKTNEEDYRFDVEGYFAFKERIERQASEHRAIEAEIRAYKAERKLKELRRQRAKEEQKLEEERFQQEKNNYIQKEDPYRLEEYEKIIQLMEQGNCYDDAMKIIKSQARQ